MPTEKLALSQTDIKVLDLILQSTSWSRPNLITYIATVSSCSSEMYQEYSPLDGPPPREWPGQRATLCASAARPRNP